MPPDGPGHVPPAPGQGVPEIAPVAPEELVAADPGKRYRHLTAGQPGDLAPWGFRRYIQTPRLVADSAGRIWLFMRPRTSARLPTSLWAAGGKWGHAALE